MSSVYVNEILVLAISHVQESLISNSRPLMTSTGLRIITLIDLIIRIVLVCVLHAKILDLCGLADFDSFAFLCSVSL